jgi:hypothetical protein
MARFSDFVVEVSGQAQCWLGFVESTVAIRSIAGSFIEALAPTPTGIMQATLLRLKVVGRQAWRAP